MRNKAAIGLIYAVLGAIGFSFKSVFIKMAYAAGVNVTDLILLRMVFSVPFFLVAAYWGGKSQAALTRADWRQIVMIGVLGYHLSNVLGFAGLTYVSAGLERIIFFIYPLVVLLVGWVYFAKPVRRYEIFAIILCLGGFGLAFIQKINQEGDGMVQGGILIFFSMLSYSFYITGSGVLVQRVGVLRCTSLIMLVACIASMIQFLMFYPVAEIFAQSAKIYEISLALALVSTVFAVMMQTSSIKLLGASHASMVGSLGPIATIYFAQIFLGETSNLWQWSGSALVILGVSLLGLYATGSWVRRPRPLNPAHAHDGLKERD
ncbi:MAG: DMT family transporter [Candidatus Symbiobacter sp.]|nr:DMT family transporter [Candidatus Symbiobacter sp.]